jgi:acetyltransferase-like isoleucine patch superfamily enzyme
MLHRILETPWKIKNEGLRYLLFPKIRLCFYYNNIPWGIGWRIYGVPIIQKNRKSIMSFGNGLQLRSLLKSNPIGPNHPVVLSTREKGSSLQIGDNFGMTGGTICASEQINIGNDVTVGANTIITDTDFHPLDIESRKILSSGGKSAAILIEDGVFIGMNCMVLKGVKIGKGSVVGAGSVVTRNIPENVIFAGNPARFISKL